MEDATALFDTGAYRRFCIAECRGQFAWDSAGVGRMTAPERDAWQRDFRRGFDAVLGHLSQWTRPPLDSVVTEARQLDGYHRETVVMTTRPGLQALGHFLVPDNCPPGRPAILCLPGHGTGVDETVGIGPDGAQRSPPQEGLLEGYSQDFALQCVAHGYPTFALELTGFGRRRDQAARDAGPGASSCGHDSMAALMLGETVAGWRVWDAMRALDYLETRTDVVDPARLSVMGISGGGLAALFTAALDTRVSACVVSCYFNTFAASVLSIDHCVDNYLPGMLRLCEMPDLAALIAPRRLFAESGVDDPIFPVAGFEQAATQAREIYGTFGVRDHFGAEIFAGGHHFHGNGAFAFLERALTAP